MNDAACIVPDSRCHLSIPAFAHGHITACWVKNDSPVEIPSLVLQGIIATTGTGAQRRETLKQAEPASPDWPGVVGVCPERSYLSR